MKNFLSINSELGEKKIVKFIKKTFAEQKINKAIIGISGGIDSATSLFLLARSLPKKNIIVLHLPYFETADEQIDSIIQSADIPKRNFHIISIKPIVEISLSTLGVDKEKQTEVRIGNIAARVRMIILYDFAKKHHALVCGTENKSEHLLAYFTRFGDEASDFEPIRHLYKSQVYQLAKHLGVPKSIIEQKPTAGLWNGQTDEGEFGFTYQEADQVLYLYFEQKLSVEEIEKRGLPNAKKIIDWCRKNSYKHHAPYSL